MEGRESDRECRRRILSDIEHIECGIEVGHKKSRGCARRHNLAIRLSR
jgi:hypothetical protein